MSAFGLLLVFEGILPFVSPERFRVLMQAIGVQPGTVLRIVGFSSMLLGLLVVSLAHYLFD
jgi:uncharacterized protein YjeT (DUF2065 family)